MNNKFKKITTLCSGIVLASMFVACSDNAVEEDTSLSLACETNALTDSGEFPADMIKSHVYSNTYHIIGDTGRTLADGTTPVSIDYMVHLPADPSLAPKALLVMIAGGLLDANLSGLDGQASQSSSGNFLVRSAHLFANQGYKVVTINAPSDVSGITGNGNAMDPYRVSSDHGNDILAILSRENTTGLPVALVGTSRGAISAVAQQNIADYLLLSSPVTSGNGSPVGSAQAPLPPIGDKPVHLIWHEADGCVVSKPSGASALAAKLSNVSAVKVGGGYNHPELASRATNKECDGSKTHHGFLGIESCVVQNATAWLDNELNQR